MLERLYSDNLIPEELYGNVIVAVTEAVLNAVNHGSKGDASKKVNCNIEVTQEKVVVVSIKDSGAGFDVDALPDPTDPKNLEKGNGRGIYIMKNLSDEIEFEEGGSKVTMGFLLKANASIGA